MTASRLSGGPAMRYISTSKVLRSAHCRSSMTSTTGRIEHNSSSQRSMMTGTSGCARRRFLAHCGRRPVAKGTVIDARGRAAPEMTRESADPAAAAYRRDLRAVSSLDRPTSSSSAVSGNLRMESVFLRAACGYWAEGPSSTVKISEQHIKESRIMNVSHHGRRWVGAASAALLLAVAVPTPAMA